MTDPRPQRHTGTVRRGALRHPGQPSPPPSVDVRAGWVALVVALLLAAGALGWLVGTGDANGAGETGSASATATFAAIGGSASPTATEPGGRSPAPTPGESPTRTAEPPPTLAPTSAPTVTPTSAPPTLTPTSTPEPSPEPTLHPTSEPPPQARGLVIDFPTDGEAVRSQRINVVGTAPPGATVTRDIPLWFDGHTVAGDDGLWMMPVELAEGENRLTFRLADDQATAQVIVVTYRPAS